MSVQHMIGAARAIQTVPTRLLFVSPHWHPGRTTGWAGYKEVYQNKPTVRPHRPQTIRHDTERDRKRPGRVPSALWSTVNDDPYTRTFSAKTVLRGERARASTVETVELKATALGSTHVPNRDMLWNGREMSWGLSGRRTIR